MIKVRFVNMHMNRSQDINDLKSREEDKAWMDGFNNNYTLTHDYTWKNIKFVMDDYDYLFVIDCVYRHFDNNGNKINYFDESKAVVMQAEPYSLRSKFPINIYDETNYDKRFIKVYKMNTFTGWIGLNYQQLLENKFTKIKKLSTIISANNGLDGHTRRLLFLRNYLSKIDCDHFGDERGQIGCFNKEPLFSKNYKGYIDCKSKGLLDYKYHFNSENSIEKDYMSEKFTDSLLCNCLTFYNGMPNLSDYIDERAFIRVNLDDQEKALYIIKTAIEDKEYEKRIDIIQQEKLKILENLNPLNLIFTSVNGYKNYWEK